jgi:hypothetical protein
MRSGEADTPHHGRDRLLERMGDRYVSLDDE